MASIDQIPENYLRFNNSQTKTISIVIEIPGIDLLSNRAVFTRIRYGDPGIVYGGAGLVYGGLRRVAGVRDLLQLDGSSLTISQKIEPEQGRGSVSMMSFAFVDKDQYMSQVISPGVILDDILGKPVKVWLGYEEISYPEDFSVIFQGVITGVSSMSGRVTLQLSDPNVLRRQNVFFPAKTTLNANITNATTVIPLVNAGDFNQQITDILGAYDPAVETWIKIDDEYMKYGPTGIAGNNITVVRSSVDPFGDPQTPAAHTGGTEVAAIIVLADNPITLALKIMLSGWNGPYRTAIPLFAFCVSGDPLIGTQSHAIILPHGKSFTRDYGASEGDLVAISGATNGGNNVSRTIVSFQDVNGEPDRLAYLSGAALINETGTSAVFSIRSQFDTLPIDCGSKLRGDDVDVGQHLFIRNTFLGSESMKFLITDASSGKTFIESELYLPVAAYSLTRKGKLSVGLTTPAIADERLQVLNQDNILDPKSISPNRATNNRKFYNQIDWQYDVNRDGKFTSFNRFLDSESLSIIKISSVLPINTNGSRTALGFDNVVSRRSLFLLDRYKRGAVQITVKVNYKMANLIEAGDVVVLQDNGQLQITNFATGERNLGSQLFEVIERVLDIRNGTGSLTLISGLQSNLQDKYATFAPSSQIIAGSSTNTLKIEDSYGALYPNDEKRKWTDYFQLKVKVHNVLHTVSEETTLIGFDPSDAYRMLVDPPLSFVPSAGYIVEPADYPNNTDATDQALWKLVHVFWTPSVPVVTGISGTQFTVSAPNALKFIVGQPVYLHKANYGFVFGSTVLSNEVVVTDVTGTTVTVESTLGYTPSAGDVVELIGFPDSGPPYRWI